MTRCARGARCRRTVPWRDAARVLGGWRIRL